MDYVFLNRGCVLPAVGVLQLLLNRQGANLKVDGIFGQHTEAVIRLFQRSHRLAVDGIVGEKTWPRLVGDERVQIADCIDITDPELFKKDAADIWMTGGVPFLLGGCAMASSRRCSRLFREPRAKSFCFG